MASNSETVYIKAERNIEVTNPQVTLGDVLNLECSNPAVVPKLKAIKLLTFHHTDKKNQNRTAVSVLRVIQLIHEKYPNIDVQNLGQILPAPGGGKKNAVHRRFHPIKMIPPDVQIGDHRPVKPFPVRILLPDRIIRLHIQPFYPV